MRAIEKCSSATFIEVDISHRLSALRMLYIETLAYISGSQNFLKYKNI